MKISDILIQYDKVTLLAPNDKEDLITILEAFDIEYVCIDYDPKYANKENYICKDFIFDNVKIDSDLAVHFNVEKTYPFKYSGDVLLIGDNEYHTGDCFPVNSHQDIIDAYNLKEVYEVSTKKRWKGEHYIVYGKM